MLWLDDQGQPEQAAHAVYVDDDVLTEHTWTPEPFDTADDVYGQLMARLDIQGRLWPDSP